MDDVSAQFTAEGDTSGARSEISSLSQIFGNLWGDVEAGASLGTDSLNKFVSAVGSTRTASEAVREVGASFGALKTDLAGIGSLISGALGDRLRGDLASLGSNLFTPIQTGASLLREGLGVVWSDISKGAADTRAGLTLAKGAFGEFAGDVKSAGSLVATAIGGITDSTKTFTERFTSIKDAAGVAVEGIASSFSGLKGKLGTIATEIGASLKGSIFNVKEFFGGFAEGIAAEFKALGGGQLLSNVKEFFGGLAEGAKGAIAEFGGLGGVVEGLGATLSAAFAGITAAAGVVAVAVGGVVAAFAAVAIPVYEAVKSFADAGDKLLKLSKETGLSTEALSAFEYISGQTDVSTQALANSVFKMGVNIETGSKKTKSAIESIGLSFEDLKKSSPDERLATIMARLGEIPDAAQRASVGVQIFGTSFRKIASLAEEDLIGMTSAAKQFGLVMSEEMAQQGDRLGDTLKDISSIFVGLRNIVGASLLPTFNNVVTVVRDGLIVAFQILKEAFTPLINSFAGAGRSIEEFTRSGDFATTVMRGIVKAVAFVVDAFAAFIRASATVVAAYYEMRIAGNLLLEAFGKVVEGVLIGAIAITNAMAKISFGEAAKSYAADSSILSEKLRQVRADVDGLAARNVQLEATEKNVTGAMRATADALNAGAAAARTQADATTLSGMEAFKAAEKHKGLSIEVENASGKLEGFAKKQESLRKEIALLSDELDDAAKHNASLADITKLYGSKIDEVVRSARVFGIALPASIEAAYNAIQQHDIAALIEKIGDAYAKTQAKLDAAAMAKVSRITDAMGKDLIAAEKVQAEFSERYTSLFLSDEDKRIAAIEKERTATLAKFDGQGPLIDAARKKVNDYYDFERDKALGTFSTIEARLKAKGVLTIAEQQKEVDSLKRDYDQMVADNHYTADEEYAVWRKYYDAKKKLDGTSGQVAIEEQDRELAHLKNVYDQMVAKGGFSADQLLDAWNKYEQKKYEYEHSGLIRFQGVLGQYQTLFAQLAQIGGATFGGIAQGVAQMFGGLNTGLKGFGDLKTSLAGLGAAAKGGFTSLIGQLGTVGAAIGAVVGAAELAWQGIKKLFDIKSGWERIQADVLRDFGGMNQISEQLAKKIEKDSETIGRQAGSLKNLAAIVQETGGVTEKNAALITHRVHDLYSELSQGLLSVEDVQKNVNAVFPQLAENLKKTGGIASAEMLDLIRLNKEFKTSSEAIANFVKENVALALEGLTDLTKANTDEIVEQFDVRLKYITRNEGGGEMFAGIRKAFKDIKDEDIPSLSDSYEDYTRKFNALTKEQQDVLTENSSMIRSEYEGDFHNLEIFTRATFAAMEGSGDTYFAALRKLAPQLKTLEEAEQKLGVTTTDAKTAELIATQKLIDAHPTLIAQIEATQKIATGLGNAVGFDQEAFDALSTTVVAQTNKMTEAGFSQDQALKAQAPSIQTIIELMDRYGFKVDAATQDLINQEVAAGNVGEAHKSAAERTVDALDKVVNRFDLMLKKMGVDVPDALDKVAGKAESTIAGGLGGAIDKVTAKTPTLTGGIVAVSGAINGVGAASDSMVDRVRTNFGAVATDGAATGSEIVRRLHGSFTDVAGASDEMRANFEKHVDAMTASAAQTGIADGFRINFGLVEGASDDMQAALEIKAKEAQLAFSNAATGISHDFGGSFHDVTEGGDLLKKQIALQMFEIAKATDGAKGSVDQFGQKFGVLRSDGTSAIADVERALHGLKATTDTVGADVSQQRSVWQTWASDAIGNIQDVQDEVNALSFGRSPGGLKEWVPMISKSIDAFDDLRDVGVSSILAVKHQVDSMTGAAASFNVRASMDGRPADFDRYAAAASASGARSVSVNMPISIEGMLDPQGLLDATREIIIPAVTQAIETNDNSAGTNIVSAIDLHRGR